MRPPAMLVMVVLLATAAEAALPAELILERVPLKEVQMEDIRERDRARHGRMGVLNISLEGTTILPDEGIYYTSIKLGKPSKEYTFQIDTGSSISWVTCSGCTRCPTKSMELYNPDSSSTSSRIACSDDRCAAAGSTVCQTSDSPSGLCGYNITYSDETIVSGYYMSDTMHFNSIMGKQHSASIVFGCTNSLSKYMATDGLLGFGQDPLSIISQLNSRGVSPKAFSHCLKGSEEGGGVLLLGKIEAPGIVFTPLVPSQSSYNLNLESIAVNGQKLPIDYPLLATSNSQGTFVDSGTTLAYIVDGAYDPLVRAIEAAVPPSILILDAKGNGKRGKCYLISSSVDLSFPTVTLYFKGGAAMKVEPSHYLLRQGTNGNGVWWCMGWQSSLEIQNTQGFTLLGDIVLRDKIIVYDLGEKRVGWTDYNCSSLNRTTSVDVSGASPYYNGLIASGVAIVCLGVLLMG